MTRHRTLLLTATLGCLAVPGWLHAAYEQEVPAFLEPPQPQVQEANVSPEVAKLLRQAEAIKDPGAALGLLRRYAGADSSLIELLIGQEEMTQTDQGGFDRAKHLTAADTAFHQALVLDPHLREAQLGEAQVATENGDYARALVLAGPAIDPAVLPQLLYYAKVAMRAGDWELANAATEMGIMRFPGDAGFRELHLELLMRCGRYDDAARAALAQLSRKTSDTDLWRTLAYAEQERGDRMGELAALEAASISAPGDQGLRLRLGQVQLSEGLPQAALATARGIVGVHPLPAQAVDLGLMTFAVRAAADAGDLPTARAWLAAIPEVKRDRSLRLLEAHVDLQAEDYAAANQALSRLIALGENDPGILVWAASIADKTGDVSRAEAFYQQATLGQGIEAENAGLRLAVLYYRHQRYSDAQVLVATYLAKHPGDPSATTLRTIIDNRLAAHAKTVE